MNQERDRAVADSSLRSGDFARDGGDINGDGDHSAGQNERRGQLLRLALENGERASQLN